ncbi:MAG: hypothetical protein AAGF92_09790 [Myxococcota bacterium]
MPLTVGYVVRRTLEVVRETAAPLITVIAVFMLPSAVIGGVLARSFTPEQMADTSNLGRVMLTSTAASLVSLVFYAIAHASALLVALDRLAGETPTFADAARKAASRLGAIVVASILFYLAIGVGFLLCFVPGFIAVAGLGLAIPALLAERLGPVDAMRRSWELTKGHRLLVFTAFFVVGVTAICISLVVQFATMGNFFADPTAPYKISLTAWILQQVFGYVLGVLYSAVLAVLAAVLYSEIRSSKEGVDVQSMTTVFE